MDVEPPLIRWLVVERLSLILERCGRPGMPWPSIHPSVEGGVQLEWRHLGHDVEVEILNTGAVTIFAATTGELEDVVGFDAAGVVGRVAQLLDIRRMPADPPKEPGAVSPKPDGSR